MRTFEVGLSLSSNSCTLSLEVCYGSNAVSPCPFFQHFAQRIGVSSERNQLTTNLLNIGASANGGHPHVARSSL